MGHAVSPPASALMVSTYPRGRPFRSEDPAVVGEPVASRGLLIVVIGLLAAVAYCSWPLGFLLNPGLASSALASSLEVAGQPYFWVFILLDCVTGTFVLVAASALWRPSTAYGAPGRMAILSYGLFGLLTAIDALMPEGCTPSQLGSCGADLARPNLDDCLTGLAVLALFVAACFGVVKASGSEAARSLVRGASVSLALWGGFGLLFFALHFSSIPAVRMQHVMLTMTSAVIVLVPALLVA